MESHLSIPMRYAPRRAHFPYWWLLATAAAAFIAVGPIVAAVLASFGGGGPSSAFAAAPAGNYAVVARAETNADVLLAVGTDGGPAREIARVPHLPGYASYGAVSPGHERVALVVADGGTQADPVASLLVVELLTGKITRAAANVDYLQTPAWAADGQSVVVSRTSAEGPKGSVRLSRVPLNGGAEETLAEASGVLGAYSVGFDGQGRFVHVVIEGRGSVLYRGGAETALLAPGITRDWRLNADGSSIAFVETVTEGGVKYFARSMALEGAMRQDLRAADASQSLGVAWRPGSEQATFGREPFASSSGPGAQALTAAGFDVPLGYSADGRGLAVQHWDGPSFAQPGEGSFELVAENGSRRPIEGASRFFGWATR